MKDIKNPYDRVFKKIEKVKENSRDLIESTFPGELLAKLDLETLENDSNSYIDESLQEFYSDLVFDCIYNGNTAIKVSILFEHKSYKPKNEYLQLLRYILNIWDYSVKNKEAPPIVIPVIFYHGKDIWEVKPIHNYFKPIDLAHQAVYSPRDGQGESEGILSRYEPAHISQRVPERKRLL